MNTMPQEDEAQTTIIDDTENDNPLDRFLVDESIVRMLFWYLVKRYTCLQPLIRVSQIMRDLNLTSMELNCAYNTLRRVFEEAPDCWLKTIATATSSQLIQRISQSWPLLFSPGSKRRILRIPLCIIVNTVSSRASSGA